MGVKKIKKQMRKHWTNYYLTTIRITGRYLKRQHCNVSELYTPPHSPGGILVVLVDW
jgi:hypothetical protein